MDLIATMLAGMRQEMAVDREAQAQTAREQAQRVDDQVRHLEDMLQSSVASLKAETQQYTDQACNSVRNELLDKVQTLEGEDQGLKEEVRTEKQRRELATARAEEQAALRVLAGTAGVVDLLGPALGPWQEPSARGPRSVVSEPVAPSGGWGAIGTPPLSPAGGRLGLSQPALLPSSPILSPFPGRPASCPHESRSPLLSPSVSRRLVKCKLAEYDGKVAWESYVAQFEMLASAQGWSEAEKALQLTTALRGPVVEVVGHLPPAQRAYYGSVAEALRHRLGHHHQAEVYRARLKKRTREQGETLSQLAQDVESYPAAPEEIIVVVARDSFIDALDDQQLQIYVKQAHPGDLQVALVRALEFEAFLKTTSGQGAAAQPRRDLRGRKEKLKGPVDVRIGVGSAVERLPVYVADLDEPCLLGLYYLTQSKACVPAGAKLGTCEEVERPEEVSGSAEVVAVRPLPDFLEYLAHRSAANLPEAQTEKVRHTLAQYADVFSRGDMYLGRTGLVKHSINTGSSSPIKSPPRRIAPARREEMQRTVNELAAQGVIERSDSPWSSAVFLVKKKDSTQRFCVDYRALNDLTAKDSYSLPRIDDTLDALVGPRWFSTLDLKSGYHQVEMAEA
ncbi:hypothetical protein O3P69_009038 [Scylla paramamosain]|uniref:Reverse transcriptase domain-containing protein n=1 Tax=Scylla paramamosain TaxID=85552 RepID=A0AAW0TTZ9_SCYPA